ncbi:hypothetical protein GCM10010266_31230 [Streptomyces griseomycini]|nr:hypothetical protein GCM10010266_31230 [Streptomyces griseomycini]GGR20969.1 hypothetical protein GCM10015536_28220 [Streptomyces griseomycini]
MANAAAPRAEAIRAFRAVPNGFGTVGGLMTPSPGLRRAAIVKAYAADVEEPYVS